MLYCESFFFFFQAEDGIRDRSPSRGLGDVYKRQVSVFSFVPVSGIYKSSIHFIQSLWNQYKLIWL